MENLLFGLLFLAIPALVLAFPVYVVNRITHLYSEVERLKSKLDYCERELARRPVAEQPAPTPSPIFAPPASPFPAQAASPFAAPNASSAPFQQPDSAPYIPLLPINRAPIFPALARIEAAVGNAPDPGAFDASKFGVPGQSTESRTEQQKKALDVESLLGSNWLAKLGIAAIAIAAAFFLQYAFRERWIGPNGQVAIGLAGAALMLGTGQYLLGKERYRLYAQSLSSGGIVVYFLSIYAACNFYHPLVMSISAGMGAFAIGALAASALAIFNKTEVPAAICILGAFAAPVLIRSHGSGVAQSMRPLYEYLVFLNVWVACLTRVRPWYSLSSIAFVATWAIFFDVTPAGSGWSSEMFATLFLLSSCYAGGRALCAVQAEPANTNPTQLPARMQVGLVIMLGGCIAFAITSVQALSSSHLFAVSDIAVAGVMLSGLLIAIGSLIPNLGSSDEQIRTGIGYLAAVSLLAMIAAAFNSTPVLKATQAGSAFAFTLVIFLVFSIAALAQHKNEAMEKPAALLAAANIAVHMFSAQAALTSVRVGGAPALVIWMPFAAGISLATAWFASRQRAAAHLLPQVFAGGALVLPIFGMLVLTPGSLEKSAADYWHSYSIALLTTGFLLLSTTWLALRRHLEWADVRVNTVATLGNAAWFAASLWLALGHRSFHGFSLVAACALLLAAYHAAIGMVVLRGSNKIDRLITLGVAVSFFTAAMPLQLHTRFVTVVWAVEAAALVWTGSTQRDRRIRSFGLALLTLTIARALIIDLLTSPATTTLFLNSRTMAGLAVTVAAYLSAWAISKASDDLAAEERSLPGILALCANIFTILFISSDLWDYSEKRWPAGGAASQLSLSLFWAAYGLGGVIVGIWQRLRPVRLFAVGLLLLSIVKVVLYDLSSLDTPYRIVSFFALGVVLLIVSLLYTRFEERLKSAQHTEGKQNP